MVFGFVKKLHSPFSVQKKKGGEITVVWVCTVPSSPQLDQELLSSSLVVGLFDLPSSSSSSSRLLSTQPLSSGQHSISGLCGTFFFFLISYFLFLIFLFSYFVLFCL